MNLIVRIEVHDINCNSHGTTLTGLASVWSCKPPLLGTVGVPEWQAGMEREKQSLPTCVCIHNYKSWYLSPFHIDINFYQNISKMFTIISVGI